MTFVTAFFRVRGRAAFPSVKPFSLPPMPDDRCPLCPDWRQEGTTARRGPHHSNRLYPANGELPNQVCFRDQSHLIIFMNFSDSASVLGPPAGRAERKAQRPESCLQRDLRSGKGPCYPRVNRGINQARFRKPSEPGLFGVSGESNQISFPSDLDLEQETFCALS